jgi:hypothetical protein
MVPGVSSANASSWKVNHLPSASALRLEVPKQAYRKRRQIVQRDGGKAEVGCRTDAVDAALCDPADFRTFPNRQKMDNLFSDILKNNGKGMATTN